MDGRVIARIGLGDHIDDRLRLLRGRCAVEVVPASDSRKLCAHVECGVDARRSVHAILRKASRAAWQMASLPWALSHRPMTKPSRSNARACAGSSPRLWA